MKINATTRVHLSRFQCFQTNFLKLLNQKTQKNIMYLQATSATSIANSEEVVNV